MAEDVSGNGLKWASNIFLFIKGIYELKSIQIEYGQMVKWH